MARLAINIYQEKHLYLNLHYGIFHIFCLRMFSLSINTMISCQQNSKEYATAVVSGKMFVKALMTQIRKSLECLGNFMEKHQDLNFKGKNIEC